MRLGLPEVAGSPQAEAAHGLRYGGLDPGPQSVGADELGRLLAPSRRLQGDVLVARPEGHEAPHRGRSGAVGPVSTSPAILRGELHLDDGRPAIVDSWGPAGAQGLRMKSRFDLGRISRANLELPCQKLEHVVVVPSGFL